MSNTFHIESGLKQGDDLSPLLFNFVLEFTNTKVKGSQEGLEFNGKQCLVCAAPVHVLGKNIIP
jgi:hypothetical protein